MSVKTGIDILVEKVVGSLILLIGESGTAKEELTHRFIEDGFEKDETILVVVFSQSSTDYIKVLQEKIPKTEEYLKKEKINFIDVHSFRSLPKEKPPNTVLLDNANDLLALSVNINDFSLKHEKLRVVFDQFSLLMLYNSPIQVLNFIQTLAARIRQRNQVAMIVLDLGVIDNQVERTLHTIVDIVAETKRSDEQKEVNQLVRIKFAKSEYEPRWVQVN